MGYYSYSFLNRLVAGFCDRHVWRVIAHHARFPDTTASGRIYPRPVPTRVNGVDFT
jgi:hypothetical protein